MNCAQLGKQGMHGHINLAKPAIVSTHRHWSFTSQAVTKHQKWGDPVQYE
jgi:hypothetical protein